MAYRLVLPESSKIHPIFHVFCLKKKLGSQIHPLASLPLVDTNSKLRSEPERIINRCMRHHGDPSSHGGAYQMDENTRGGEYLEETLGIAKKIPSPCAQGTLKGRVL